MPNDAPGCSGTNAWDSDALNDSYDNTLSGYGDGPGGYFFAGGPGIDPNYDGTTSEAYNWGAEEGGKALAEWQGHPDLVANGLPIAIDVEEDGSQGWNELNENCEGDHPASIPYSVKRATLNGILQSLEPAYEAVIYGAPGNWAGIFGTGGDGQVPNTAQWTASVGANCAQYAPLYWSQTYETCDGGGTNNAVFFGGVTEPSDCAILWQWEEGDKDYDQIATNRIFSCL